jgi:hypothetical protein
MGLHMTQAHTKSQSWKTRGSKKQTWGWRGPKRTVASWGITGPELNRLSGAVHFMKLHCQPRLSSLWWLTIDSPASRDEIADVWKRITRLQSQYRLRPYSVAVFERSGGLHAHIVFIGNPEIARRLKASKQFGELVDVQPVTDHEALVRKYLAKERTPQAGYNRGHVLGGRIKGSHPLEGGGDRVRLSDQLARDAIVAGYVRPWQRTNAKRKPASTGKPRPRGLKKFADNPVGEILGHEL